MVSAGQRGADASRQLAARALAGSRKLELLTICSDVIDSHAAARVAATVAVRVTVAKRRGTIRRYHVDTSHWTGS